MTGDRSHLKKSCRGWLKFRLSSHRIGIILIVLSFVWGMYLIRIQINDKQSQSDYLKRKIIVLSQEYIEALAKEKGLHAVSDFDNVDVQEMKKATAVLLQNMLARIKNLEKQVEDVILNSTSEFQHLIKQIKSLNNSINNVNRTKGEFSCEIPDDAAFPNCGHKVKWMEENWKSDQRFALYGVNGSICSILNYLSEVEHWCPRRRPKSGTEEEICTVPTDPAFPHCPAKIKWMEQFWSSDSKYASHGVDGSLCSFITYLSEVENFCPLRLGRHVKEDCAIPVENEFPDCGNKIAWMRQFWKSDQCYASEHGVNGTICSFIIYLSEVERWCPLLPGRTSKDKKVPPGLLKRPDLSRTDVAGLLNILKADKPVKFEWIKQRIKQMWPHWQAAFASLKNKRDLQNTVQKKILIHIGLLSNEEKMHFAEQATKGGPLGEMVQWSDIIASLYVLGHDVTVSADLTTLQRAMGDFGKIKKQCPQEMPGDLDLVYIDYIGLRELTMKLGQLLPQFKLSCVL